MITVVLGGQYGDEGKGSVVSWLTSCFTFDLVMRFGGTNAGHSSKKGEEVFDMQQLPCSWVNQDAPIYLPETALIDKEIFLKEVALVREHGYKGKIYLSPHATLIDKEDLGWQDHNKKIGSMGSGVGVTRAKRCLRQALKVGLDGDLAHFWGDDFTPHHILADRKKQILIEASQGFGLSLNFGRGYPYTTSTDLTLYNILAECGIPYGVHEIQAFMVIRTYPIRVPNPPNGSSGFMWQELTWDTIRERHGDIKIQCDFRPPVYPKPIPKRIAEFDGALVKMAIWHSNPKLIFLTHMDWLFPKLAKTGITVEVQKKVKEFETMIGGRCIEYVSSGVGEMLPVWILK